MDDLGVWEPLWSLNGWYQEVERKEREALAEQALRELSEAGIIALYRRPWATQNEPDRVPLLADEVETELRASWWREIPLPSGDVWITATEQAARFANQNAEPD